MFDAISRAFTAFFSMLTRLCGAGEKAAGAVDNLAGWAEESSATFHDEAKHNRALSLEEAAFKRTQKKKELAALVAAADAEASTVIAQAAGKGAKSGALAS